MSALIAAESERPAGDVVGGRVENNLLQGYSFAEIAHQKSVLSCFNA